MVTALASLPQSALSCRKALGALTGMGGLITASLMILSFYAIVCGMDARVSPRPTRSTLRALPRLGTVARDRFSGSHATCLLMLIFMALTMGVVLGGVEGRHRALVPASHADYSLSRSSALALYVLTLEGAVTGLKVDLSPARLRQSSLERPPIAGRIWAAPSSR